MNISKILAVDPGTRFVGVALLEHNELLYSKVKIIKDNQTPRRVFHYGKDILRDLIKEFRPDCVALERPFVHSNTELVRALTDELAAEAARHGLPIFQYLLTTIRYHLCGDPDATKRDVAGLVAKTFPEMSLHLDHLRQSHERYYSHIFDAIAVGLMCQADLRRGTELKAA